MFNYDQYLQIKFDKSISNSILESLFENTLWKLHILPLPLLSRIEKVSLTTLWNQQFLLSTSLLWFFLQSKFSVLSGVYNWIILAHIRIPLIIHLLNLHLSRNSTTCAFSDIFLCLLNILSFLIYSIIFSFSQILYSNTEILF